MNGKQDNCGAVAAGHPATAQTAAAVLKDGGNAFDAAIAALLAACVCEPVLASPGGGGFMMVKPAGGKAELIDFFCDTPLNKRPAEAVEFAGVFADFGTIRQPFHIGLGSTATPGMLTGLQLAADRHACLAMSDLAAPAVALAAEGVAVTEFQAFLFQVVSPILTWTEEARALFAPKGELLQAGDLMVNPELAETLIELGSGNTASLTEAMITAIDPERSHLSAQDFEAYRPERRKPIEAALGRHRIMLNPRPALGGALVAAMLQALGDGAIDAAGQATAIADVDRTWREGGIDAVWPADRTAREGGKSFRGTTHISVIDAAGNAVAATVSNGEGNGRVVPGRGFMMNNMLGEEDVNPDGFHNWAPGRRLGSMMTPSIVEVADGSLQALGSGGSNRIRTAIFQVLVNRLAAGLPPAQAVTAARVHFEREKLDIECADRRADTEKLCTLFSDCVRWPDNSLYFGGVHHVERGADGRFSGAGDPRREGVFIVV
jgi:gamma-glutamyltranspeptidase/glutathione hydrolase